MRQKGCDENRNKNIKKASFLFLKKSGMTAPHRNKAKNENMEWLICQE